MVGDHGIGKTSLVDALNGALELVNKEPTLASSFVCLRYNKSYINIFDTAGQDRYRSLIPIYIRGNDVIIICIDSNGTMNGIISALRYWVQFVSDSVTNKARVLVVMCKCDKVSVDTVVIDNVLSEWGYNDVTVMNTSAVTREGINQLLDILDNSTTAGPIETHTVEIRSMRGKSRCC